MLNGMYLYISLSYRSRPFDEFHMVDFRIDRRFIRQIDSLEFDSVIDRRRVHPQGDLGTRMQRCPGEARALSQRLLVKKGHIGGDRVSTRTLNVQLWRSAFNTACVRSASRFTSSENG